MTSPENKKTLEKSSFQVIEDGAGNQNRNRSIVQKDQKDWKTVEIIPYSKSVQLQKKKQTSEPEHFQIPKPNPNPIPAQVSARNPNPKEDEEKRIKSESERSAAQDCNEADDVGGVPEDVDVDVSSRVQVNETEVQKLKAQVKNLMKFKAKVQKLGEDDEDESEDANDEENQKEKEGGKTKEDPAAAATESTERPRPRPSPWVFIILYLISMGMWVLIAVLATKEHYQNIQANNELARAMDQANKKTARAMDQVTQDIYLYNQTNYQGSIHVISTRYLNDNSCYNLNRTGDDFASSIETHGQCVFVFEDSDCTGKKQEFSEETRNTHDLTLWGLNKTISSIQACKILKGQY